MLVKLFVEEAKMKRSRIAIVPSFIPTFMTSATKEVLPADL
jgi:hypothetical protein